MDKRVLIVATSRKTRGGITSVIKAHEKGAQWNKYSCHWVQTHRDGPAWRKILYFLSGMADFLVRLPFYDIVHIHTADYGTEKRKRIFARITKLLRKKLIIHLHSSDPKDSIGGKYRDLYDYSFNHADKILLLSNEWKKVASRAFPANISKMDVLYNPCPSVEKGNPDMKHPYILYAGTVNTRKGYHDLLNAFAMINKSHPDWTIVFAGNGEIDKGKELAEKLHISHQVKFVGWVAGEDKDRWFSNASAYCLPSYSEGFPMGVLDAWGYGLPVVTTPVGGIPDVAVNGENMLLFAPGDIDGLSRQLSCIMDSPELRQALTNASKKFSEQDFNINTIANKLDLIYSEL